MNREFLEKINVEAFLKGESFSEENDFLVSIGTKLLHQASTVLNVAWGTSLSGIPFFGDPRFKEPLRVVEILKKAGLLQLIWPVKQSSDLPRHYGFTTKINNGRPTSGNDFFDPLPALWASLAEGLERSLWINGTDYFRDVLVLSVSSAKKKGALDPWALSGFDNVQRNSLPGLLFDEHSRFTWIKGFNHINRDTLYIPAQLVSAKFFKEAVMDEKKEPRLRTCVTTGLATAPDYEGAALRGLLEVIERDAFMISWLNHLSPPRLDLASLARFSPKIKEVLESFSRYLFDVHVLLLPTDFSVPVVCTVIVDKTNKGSKISVGAKADFSLENAILGALSESLNVYIGNRYRHSLENSLPDISKMGQHDRLDYWSRAEHFNRIQFFIEGPFIEISNEEVSTLHSSLELSKFSHKKQLAGIISRVKNLGYSAVSVDMSSSKFNKSDLKVVFSIIPEAQPLHLDEQFPYFSGKRLREVPEKLGFIARDTLFTELPHPFP